MTTIIAIETATPACSVALQTNNQCLERYEMTPRGHAAMVLPMIQSLLEETKHVLLDVDFFAFGKGPGSFTGNRIATSVIQGLAFGVNKPVAAVSTLQALAQGAYRLYGATQVLVGLDARKDQIYWGLYACVNGIMEVCIPDQVSDPQCVEIPEGTTHAVGQAWQVYAARCPQSLSKVQIETGLLYPHAKDLIPMAIKQQSLGVLIEAKDAMPCYIRDQVV